MMGRWLHKWRIYRLTRIDPCTTFQWCLWWFCAFMGVGSSVSLSWSDGQWIVLLFAAVAFVRPMLGNPKGVRS